MHILLFQEPQQIIKRTLTSPSLNFLLQSLLKPLQLRLTLLHIRTSQLKILAPRQYQPVRWIPKHRA